MQNSIFNKITAWVVIVATVVVMLFSSLYLVEHAEHNCTGNDCPICSVMEQCSNNLKTLATALIIVCILMSLIKSLWKNICFDVRYYFCNSLISQKVRMNN